MSVERETLAHRVRAALPDAPRVREVSMFGGLSFMVDGGMVVAVGRDGDLLVRIDPTRHDELRHVPGTRPAVMGADRPMGPGWITVSRDALTTGQELAFWIQVGMAHRAGLALRRSQGS